MPKKLPATTAFRNAGLGSRDDIRSNSKLILAVRFAADNSTYRLRGLTLSTLQIPEFPSFLRLW
jgi:hypothetical protein